MLLACHALEHPRCPCNPPRGIYPQTLGKLLEMATSSAGIVFPLRRFLKQNRQRKVKFRELERGTQHLHYARQSLPQTKIHGMGDKAHTKGPPTIPIGTPIPRVTPLRTYVSSTYPHNQTINITSDINLATSGERPHWQPQVQVMCSPL